MTPFVWHINACLPSCLFLRSRDKYWVQMILWPLNNGGAGLDDKSISWLILFTDQFWIHLDYVIFFLCICLFARLCLISAETLTLSDSAMLQFSDWVRLKTVTRRTLVAIIEANTVLEDTGHHLMTLNLWTHCLKMAAECLLQCDCCREQCEKCWR